MFRPGEVWEVSDDVCGVSANMYNQILNILILLICRNIDKHVYNPSTDKIKLKLSVLLLFQTQHNNSASSEV